jgi:glycosyltransferase involved in cell wall biosynthesis
LGANGQDSEENTGMEVALIIPAYNEASNLPLVLDVVCKSPCLDKIIVVDDGSVDSTADVAGAYENVNVIRQHNRGKAGAMEAGIESTDEAILLFLDADLRGLRQEHIKALIDPVSAGEYDMTMGLFYGPPHPSRWAHRLSPGLSGQRAVKREVFDLLNNYGDLGYGIETAFTKLVNRGLIKMKRVRLEGVSQIMKEEKNGFMSGAKLRMRMFYEVVRTRLSRPYKRT